MYIRLIGRVLASIVCFALAVVIVSEILRTYRGRKNKTGTLVPGWALYERAIVAKRMGFSLGTRSAGWEIIEFHQFQLLCDWQKRIKQGNWKDERKQKQKIKMSYAEDSPYLYTDDELPEVRYRCMQTEMLYRPGMGWGLY